MSSPVTADDPYLWDYHSNKTDYHKPGVVILKNKERNWINRPNGKNACDDELHLIKVYVQARIL